LILYELSQKSITFESLLTFVLNDIHRVVDLILKQKGIYIIVVLSMGKMIFYHVDFVPKFLGLRNCVELAH